MFVIGEIYRLIAVKGGPDISKAEYYGKYNIGKQTLHRFKHRVYSTGVSNFVDYWSTTAINRNLDEDWLFETHLDESGINVTWNAISHAYVEKTITFHGKERLNIYKLGDVVEISIEAENPAYVKLFIMGENVWNRRIEGKYKIEETINLVKIGYDSVFLQTSAPITIKATYKTYKDIEMRKLISKNYYLF